MTRVAIIGAGLAGLVLARKLPETFEVNLFEKSRGLGGRMATRRADPFGFDHGAQYFTAKSDAFRAFLKSFMEDGAVADWNSRLVRLSADGVVDHPADHPCLVAVPGMNALAKSLAAGLAIHQPWLVSEISGRPGHWIVHSEQGETEGPFDWIVSSVPFEQAGRVMPEPFSRQLQTTEVKMHACFTLMLGFDHPINLGFDGAFVDDEIIGWIADNSSKPGRSNKCSIVVQTRNDWAQANSAMPKEDVERLVIGRLLKLTGMDFSVASHLVTHRWLYASTPKPANAPFLIDAENGLAAIGDWCIRGRVEAAFESGSALADELKRFIA